MEKQTKDGYLALYLVIMFISWTWAVLFNSKDLPLVSGVTLLMLVFTSLRFRVYLIKKGDY